MATVHLRRTEQQFWKMTPRKYVALANAHIYYKSGGKQDSKGDTKEKVTTGFIDQVL